jgi:ABC-type lipoprotein export system ATPase subunit
VELRDVYCLFGTRPSATVALQGLDLRIEEGEVVVALGPSGSGKSTLLRVLAGMERVAAGSATVLGTDITSLGIAASAAFRAAQIGLLDQHYARSLSPDLTCRHSVGLQLELLGTSRAESRRVALELLERVGLGDRAEDRPGDLSGGEQQRVAVCAAIAHRPRLLLADEPAGELDATNAAGVYRLLGELVRETAATAFVVSHDAAAATIADRLVSIRDGRIVEEWQPGERPQLSISRKGWTRLPLRLRGDPERALLATFEREHDRFVLTPAHPELLADGPPPSQPPAQVHGQAQVCAELDAVCRTYPTPRGERVVFTGVSHKFRAGTLTGLVGRSGSGKTTLLHILAGLDRPSGGRVVVAGHELSGRSRSELAELRRREVALVTQEPGLIPYLSALENVLLGMRIRASGGERLATARASLAEVGLSERSDHLASLLSAGERARVAIARALATEASLLLVDEPTARLDEANGLAIGELLAHAALRPRLAVICATHDPALIELMDETIVLDTAPAPAPEASGSLGFEVSQRPPSES